MTDWQPVPGFPGYEASDAGEVRDTQTGRVLGQWPNDQGYLMVRLSRPVRKLARVHRLIAAAFVPNPDGLPIINHLNNDRADNRPANLEWCTQPENLRHARRQGRMPTMSETVVRQLRCLRSQGAAYRVLAIQFGVSESAVAHCVTGRTYAHVK